MPGFDSTTEPDNVEGYRWVIGVLLAVGVLVNYFDRVNLSVSHDALVARFGISPELFGHLSSAYSWTYAACQLPVGLVLDRFGVRRVSLWSILLWGVASMAAAVSPTLLLFFLARLLLGIGEAPTFPANAKAVGLWFPSGERSLATAMFDGCAKFANGIGVPMLGLFLLHFGWRLSFGFTAMMSFAFLGVFALLYREPLRTSLRDVAPVRLLGRSGETSSTALALVPPIPLLRLLRQPKVLGIAIGFGSYNYVFYLLLTWLPTYLRTALNLTQRQSFLLTAVPWCVAGVLELVFGGLLTDLLIRRGLDSSKVRKTVLVFGMLCGLGIFGTAYAHTVTQALVWITISIGGLSIAAAVGWSVPSLIVPNSSTGAVSGIVNFSNQISAICAPIVTGYIVGHTHSFALAFTVAAAYLLVGICAYVFLLRRIELIPLAVEIAA